MTNSLAEVEAFAATHPHPHQGGTWNQKCEQFINNAGGFSQAFTTALLAGNASGHLDPDPTSALPGEIHYWSGLGDGHDAFQTEKGLLCASNAIPGYLGYISFATFKKAKPGFIYRGHTFRHGTQTLARTSTAGTGTVIPLTDPNMETDMRLVEDPTAKNADGTNLYWVIGNGAPYKLVGNQTAANDFNALQGLTVTVTPTKAQFPTFLQQCTPPATAGGTNLQPVLDQLATIGKLEAADQTALIAAINNLPAAVRAKIIAP